MDREFPNAGMTLPSPRCARTGPSLESPRYPIEPSHFPRDTMQHLTRKLLLGLTLNLAALFAAGSAQSVAGLPYYDGFESGVLGPEWSVTTQGYGQVQVTSANGPFVGTSHVTIDTTQDGFTAHASLILAVALEGLTDVSLSFAHREYGDEPDPEDGLWLSADGVHYFMAFPLDAGTQTYTVYNLDLDAAAASLGLPLSTPFYLRFRWKDNFSIPTDGFGFDEIFVTAADCNQNGQADALDIATGVSVDCDGNGFPDECDIATGGGSDFDLDGVLDACATPALFAQALYFSIITGGQQQLAIDVGVAHAGELYLTLGSLSGTQPGLPVAGFQLPLNLDGYFLYSLQNPGSPFLMGSFGTLSATGTGTTTIAVPAGLAPSLIGLTAHHAAVILDAGLAVTAVTNAVPLHLVQ